MGMSESMHQCLVERRQIFAEAIAKEKKPKRVPILANDWGWKIHDAGHTYSEALYNNSVMEEVMRAYCGRYAFDAVLDPGARNPLSVTKPFGSDKYYIIDDEKHMVAYKDVAMMSETDYDALIDNPAKYFWEVFIPRKCENLQKKENGAVFIEGLAAFAAYGQSQARIAEIQTEYGKVGGFGGEGFYLSVPIESLFSQLRGIIGLSIDLRRRKDKVKAAMLALDSIFEPDQDSVPAGHNENNVFDGFNSMLAHTILSNKLFEELYFPYMKKNAEFAHKKGKTMLFFAEGDTERFYDYIKELPKGCCAFLPEKNDIFNAKKELDNMCIVGGMPTELLGKGTKEQCVDYAKKLVDELSGDGGYIYCEDKMMSYPGDAKRENLQAVYNFIQGY